MPPPVPPAVATATVTALRHDLARAVARAERRVDEAQTELRAAEESLRVLLSARQLMQELEAEQTRERSQRWADDQRALTDEFQRAQAQGLRDGRCAQAVNGDAALPTCEAPFGHDRPCRLNTAVPAVAEVSS